MLLNGPLVLFDSSGSKCSDFVRPVDERWDCKGGMICAVELRWTTQFGFGDPDRDLLVRCGGSSGHRCRALAFDFLWVEYILSDPLLSFFVISAFAVGNSLIRRQRPGHGIMGTVAQRLIRTFCNVV